MEDEEDAAYSVNLIMDVGSLTELLSRSNDEEILFFFFWLREQHTKVVVPKKGRNSFISGLEEKAQEAPDVYRPIISLFRGYTTPYRFKYVVEAGISGVSKEQYNDEMPEEEIVMIISNWHYATVQYIIVKNPETYRKASKIKIRPERITNIDGFYKLISTENPECVKRFKSAVDSVPMNVAD